MSERQSRHHRVRQERTTHRDSLPRPLGQSLSCLEREHLSTIEMFVPMVVKLDLIVSIQGGGSGQITFARGEREQ
jgi:hypothetical protein